MRCHICDTDSTTVVWNDELKTYDPCDVCMDIIRDAVDEPEDEEFYWEIEE